MFDLHPNRATRSWICAEAVRPVAGDLLEAVMGAPKLLASRNPPPPRAG